MFSISISNIQNKVFSPTCRIENRALHIQPQRPLRSISSRLRLISFKLLSSDWDDVEVLEDLQEPNWEPIDEITEEELQDELDLFRVSEL